jgi:ATP-binding cassette subfamily F protein 3
MIQLRNIGLHFGSQEVLHDFSCIIQDADRIALVGRNGSGKSTMLRLIAGLLEPDTGSVARDSDTKIAYVAQEAVLSSTRALMDEAIEGLLDEDMLYMSGQLRAQAAKILIGLGFKQEQFDVPVDTLSMGWRMRVILARLLLAQADFYLFDEPTNHLDLPATEWLVSYLKGASCGFIMVCHDRYMLDALCTKTISLDADGKIYAGNYSFYRQKKEQQDQALQVAYEEQQREIARKRITIARFRASSARAAMVQSMIKELNDLVLVIPPKPINTIHVPLPALHASGRFVVTVQHLLKKYGSKIVLSDVSCSMQRSSKVALIGPNGKGKTTLLRCLIDQQQADGGSIIFGHNVSMAIFEQDQSLVLTPSNTIVQEVLSHAPASVTEAQIRNVLGALLFSGDMVDKKISVLSGGERQRVGMAKILVSGANFLLLDEPTNHLDIESKECIAQALIDFKGTVLFVSHDHDFITNVATHIFALTDQGFEQYDGTYDAYRYFKSVSSNQAIDTTIAVSDISKKPMHKTSLTGAQQHAQKKEIRRLEGKIERLEAERKRLTYALESMNYEMPDFKEYMNRLEVIEKEHGQVFEQWNKLLEK